VCLFEKSDNLLSLDHGLTWANAQPRTAAFDADGRGLNSSTRFTLLEAAAVSGAIRADISATDLLYAIAHLCTPVPGEDLCERPPLVRSASESMIAEEHLTGHPAPTGQDCCT